MAKKSNLKPSYMEDEIFRYLRDQQKLQINTEFSPGRDEPAEPTVRDILEGILHKVELRALIKDVYEEKVREHNQYALFDLGTIIPEFHIDDKMYERLTFRETLVVSTFGESSHEPIAVGGLCLDIQKAQGAKPFQRLKPGFEQKVIETITRKLQGLDSCSSGTSVHSDKVTTEGVTVDRSFADELHEYEEFLREEMRQEYCKFLVHISSQFDYQGSNGGSRITSWVDRNLHTLEEKRREYVIIDNAIRNQKTLYTSLNKKCYYVKHTSTEDNLDKRKYYSLAKTRDYISEGSSYVLMRYLAITRYIGTIELSTMYINGDMCRNIYACKGPESGIINGNRIDLCRIYRVIIEECGIKHKCCTILTLNGQILKQDWKYCNYVVHLNPHAYIDNAKPCGNERLLLNRTWEHDMELYSKYLDQKNINYLKTKSYLLDHPELKDLLADYVQLILQMKPQNILDFTISYFLHFTPEQLPLNEFLDGEDAEQAPFRM